MPLLSCISALQKHKLVILGVFASPLNSWLQLPTPRWFCSHGCCSGSVSPLHGILDHVSIKRSRKEAKVKTHAYIRHTMKKRYCLNQANLTYKKGFWEGFCHIRMATYYFSISTHVLSPVCLPLPPRVKKHRRIKRCYTKKIKMDIRSRQKVTFDRGNIYVQCVYCLIYRRDWILSCYFKTKQKGVTSKSFYIWRFADAVSFW